MRLFVLLAQASLSSRAATRQRLDSLDTLLTSVVLALATNILGSVVLLSDPRQAT